VDLGDRRIGVALSDSQGALALPYEVVARSGDEARDHRRLAELAAEAEVDSIVVGMPYSLDGSIGPAAARIAAEVERLANVVPVPVETVDERLTTVSAHRSLRASNVKGRKRRQVVDKVAAAVILQGWLDAKRAQGDR